MFAALAGAAYAIGRLIGERDRRSVAHGSGVVVAALGPVLFLAVAFPEGGTEPFTFPVLWPILLIAAVSLLALPRDEWVLRTGVVLYVLGCLGSYAVPSPVGSNAARLAPLLAGPLAALLWWRRRTAWLLAVALPLLYIQWQAPVRDVRTSANDPSDNVAYWKPLLSFLGRQGGPPFRVEVPFTQFHFEAYHLAQPIPASPRLGASGRHQGQPALLRRRAHPRRATSSGCIRWRFASSPSPMCISTTPGARRTR